MKTKEMENPSNLLSLIEVSTSRIPPMACNDTSKKNPQTDMKIIKYKQSNTKENHQFNAIKRKKPQIQGIHSKG